MGRRRVPASRVVRWNVVEGGLRQVTWHGAGAGTPLSKSAHLPCQRSECFRAPTSSRRARLGDLTTSSIGTQDGQLGLVVRQHPIGPGSVSALLHPPADLCGPQLGTLPPKRGRDRAPWLHCVAREFHLHIPQRCPQRQEQLAVRLRTTRSPAVPPRQPLNVTRRPHSRPSLFPLRISPPPPARPRYHRHPQPANEPRAPSRADGGRLPQASPATRGRAGRSTHRRAGCPSTRVASRAGAAS